MTPGGGPVRLAIVGCGGAALECHLQGVLRTDAVELVGLVDPVPANAERLRAAMAGAGRDVASIQVVTAVDDLEDVQAAVVSTPHRFHAETAIALLSKGVHCLIEKPMCLDVAECDRVIATAEANGLVVTPAHVRRLFPASRWIREWLASGRLGRVVALRWSEGAPYDWPLVSPSLFSPHLSGGGVSIDSGPHILDLILWWLGRGAESVRVVRYSDTSRGGAESEATMELDVDGVDVRVDMSRFRAMRNTCEIEGSEATIEFGVDVQSPFTVSVGGRTVERGEVAATHPAQSEWFMLFAEQLRNFAYAVRGEEAAYVSPYAGRLVVSVLTDCYAARRAVAYPWDELVPL